MSNSGWSPAGAAYLLEAALRQGRIGTSSVEGLAHTAGLWLSMLSLRKKKHRWFN